MGGAPAVAPGLLVAERYRIESPLSGDTETVRVGKLWRAYDEVLARPVAILLVRGDDPGVPDVLAGARAAAGLTHAAVVRVYDAGEAPGLAFVVTEFLSGGSLEGQLLIGPLDPAIAVDLVSDLAIGVAAAHHVGLHGLSLTPRSVLFTATGAPRLVGIGLAGYTAPSTEPLAAPLRADASGASVAQPLYAGDAAELERGRLDAIGLARLLYAALTARWAGLAVDSALPAAPYTEGHLLTPRQVRGGVPREVDEVVARALGDDSLLRGLPEITSPAEFAAALAPLRAATDDAHPYGADTGPITDLETIQARLVNTRLVPAQVWQRWAVGLGVLLLGVVVAGLLFGGNHGYLSFVHGAEPAALTPTPTGTPKITPSATAGADAIAVQPGAITPGVVTEFDPYGKHDDPHVSEAPRAVDGNSATLWRTQIYRTADLGKLKPGVGLLMDLGTPRKVAAIHLLLVGDGTSVEVFESDSAPANEKAMTLAAANVSAPSDITLRLSTETTARYWVVWLTKLPPAATGFQGGIVEMTFLS